MKRTYKLTNDIKDFILEQKKANPHLSCRALTLLIHDKFNKRISKSSVNVVLKASGLSSNVGRPAKPKLGKEGKPSVGAEVDCAGAFFLKGIDEQLSLSVILKQFSRNAFPKSNPAVLEHKNNIALYWPVFHPEGLEKLSSYSGIGLWHVCSSGKKISNSSVIKYLHKIDELDIIPNIIKGIEMGAEYVHFLAIHPKKGEIFYIDPSCHLIWQKPKGVNVYNLPIIKAQELIKDIFFNNKPLILLTSRPYQPLSQDLARFFSVFSGDRENQIKVISLLDANGGEVFRIDKVPARRRDFIFAALPWHLPNIGFSVEKSKSRRMKFDLTEEEFILNSTQLNLTQLIANKEVNLRLIFMRGSSSQPRLCLLTNISHHEKPDDEIASLYLNRWPNMEETFEDMLKKVELTKLPQLDKDYAEESASRRDTSKDNYIRGNSNISNKLRINFPEGKLSFQRFLMHLLEYLNTVCQIRFFPSHYKASLSLTQMRERFYSLPGKIVETEKSLTVYIYYPTRNFDFLSDLTYACCRFNEDNIHIRHKQVFMLAQAR